MSSITKLPLPNNPENSQYNVIEIEEYRDGGECVLELFKLKLRGK